MTGAHRLSLRQVLDVDCLAGTTVLAGETGLDRTVTRLNVMEVPDVIDWVKPHELLVTTGYSLTAVPGQSGDPTEIFVQLVRDLADRKTAALGIKVGRYLDKIPDEVLAVANSLDFPLLGLPPDVGFDDLLQQVHARLHEGQAAVLERIDALHEALARLVLEGGDLEQIAAEVARVLSVGVLLTSTDGRVQAEAITADMRRALDDAGLFAPEGRFRVERASSRPMPLGDGQIRLQPVVAGGSDLARLVCFSPSRIIAPDDVHALERAATVAALLITRQQAVGAVESKYRGDFLRDVLSGRAGNREYVLEYATGLGWNIQLPAVVICAELDPPKQADSPAPSRLSRTWQVRFSAAWGQVIRSHDKTIPTASVSAEVVTLLPVPEQFRESPDEAQAAVRKTLAVLVTAVAGDKGGGRRPFSIGVSRLVWSLDELPGAYAQARRANEVGRRVNGGGGTTHFDDLGVHRLIGLVTDRDELTAFARDVLRELFDDTIEARELCTTLQVLLDSNLNVAEASRIQFFHYNTMRYRIGKLERILGPFTTDPNLRLNIAMALQVREIQD